MYIPYGRQSIDDSDIQAVVDVLKSDYLTTGPKIKEFEDVVKAYTGAKYAVAVANGTAALHAACFAAGIGEGDEVITTPITFAASANCILYNGGTPVFADIKSDTWNIDPEEIEAKITPRTKAIIPVHFTGQPCEMKKIREIARKHHLIVIEDAAHAFGAKYNGNRIGSDCDMAILSFHPVKHITTGEGGMILTNSEEYYRRLRRFATHGITKDTGALKNAEGAWYYEQQLLGYNYRITDIQCALGISQMKRLDSFIEKRKRIAENYNRAFENIPEIHVPYQEKECDSSWHLYIIRVANRKEVFDRLREKGIGVNVHYIPVYHHPYYRENGFGESFCRNAERYYSECISLPIYPDLSDDEQQYVIQNVINIVRELKKS